MKTNTLFIRCMTLLLAAVGTTHANAQTISTYAGTGTGGFYGDGGAATAAQIYLPYGLAVDASNNLYICDQQNERIRKVSASGIITTIAGNGTAAYGGDGGAATAAQFNDPAGVVVDASNNVYVADRVNNRIRKITPAGIISTFAGIGSAGYSGDGAAATAAQVNDPWGIGIDPSGNIYIADRGNNSIRKVNTSGVISTVAGYGSYGYSGDGAAATAAKMRYPTSVTADGSGNIFIADEFNNCIRKVDPSGIITTFVSTGTTSGGYSGDGGPATAAQVNFPRGVALDAAGNLYIDDLGNHRIRKVSTSGIISTVAGLGTAGFSGDGGAATAAQLNSPYGIALDASGDLFISDEVNHRVRKVTACVSPVVSAITGSSTICLGSTTSLTDPTTGGTWSSSTTSVATVNSTGVVTGVSVGIDTIFYAVANSCGTTRATLVLNVITVPVVAPITGIDSVCPGHTTTLSDTSAGGVWVSSNMSLATISAAGIVTGVASGMDTIRYVVTNTCGSDTASVAFKVRSHAACSVGLEEVGLATAFAITIYPNPTSGNFTLNIPSIINEEAHIIIINMLGEKVKELSISTNKETPIQINVPAGVYFISAQTGVEKITTKVLIE